MHRILLVIALALASVIPAAGQTQKLADGLYAEIKTERGTILCQLEFQKTPMTVSNFVGLAEGTLKVNGQSGRRFYDGLTFHRIVPGFVIRWAVGAVGDTWATVMDDRCVLCGECVANCPAKALQEVGGRVRADPRLCISCYCCSEVCARRAIVMRRPLAGRVLYAIARLAQGRNE